MLLVSVFVPVKMYPNFVFKFKGHATHPAMHTPGALKEGEPTLAKPYLITSYRPATVVAYVRGATLEMAIIVSYL